MIFLPVVNAMSDTEVEAIASESLPAKQAVDNDFMRHVIWPNRIRDPIAFMNHLGY
jgi:hypothetical protein